MKFFIYFVSTIRIFNVVVAKNVFDLSSLSISDEEAKAIDNLRDSPQNEKRSFGEPDQQQPQMLDSTSSQTEVEELKKQKEQEQETQEQGMMAQNFDAFSAGLLSVTPEKETVSIFSYYLRDNYDFIHSNPELLKRIIIFLPTDDAVKKLASKPWEFPTPVSPGMDEKEADDVAKDNILNFVKSHMINVTDLKYKLPDKDDLEMKSLNSHDITIKNKSGEFYVNAKGRDGWHKIKSTNDHKYGDQNMTLIVIEGVLDWPERY